ncbi:MAG TPA: hypothetical protein VEK56_11825 [Vicinamibacterales bacterium]|nr:hypothetical protein [Vicinamibacterales bacterium]
MLTKLIAVAGVLLIVAGVLALAYQQISYTTRETVVDIGPLEATTETRKTVPLPPLVGIVAVAGGVIMLIAARKRRP